VSELEIPSTRKRFPLPMGAKNQSPSSRFAFKPFCKQLFFCAEIEGSPRQAIDFTLLLALRVKKV
jgi:hypothetical protein